MFRNSQLACAGGFFLLAAISFAQDHSGRISGTVTDNSGAVIPGAKIVVNDVATQANFKATTDENGFYVVPNLPVGTYNVEVEASGFRKAERTGYDLTDRGRITADFKLEVGTVTESVVVTAARGETVNTVSGEISRTIDAEQVRDLALNGRNYLELITVLPGVALLDPDQMATTTSLSVAYFSVNGQRSGTSHLAVDGGMNLDSGSNTSQINNVGVDFIREVSVQTSAFSAQYGRNSGAAINVVTKSGTDQFHGSLHEFLRNEVLDAKDRFAPVRPKLRFNNFGWTLGGPIAFGGLKKGKLYFFAGQDYKRIRRLTNPARRTLPTRADRLGDFTARTATVIRIPGTQTPVPSKNLSSQMTVDGRAIMKVYDAMEKFAVSYVDTPTTNNATFQVLNPFNFREDIVRIDYRINEKQNMYGRWVHDNYNTIDPFGTFNGSDLPTTPTLRNRPGYGPQAGHTYSISSRLINEAKLATSWNGQRTPLQGDAWDRGTYGFQFPRIFGGNGLYSTGIPDVSITNFASFNGPARVYLASPTTDISFSDNVTYLRGRHHFQGGIMIVRNRKDQNGRSIYDGNASFSTGGNTNTTNFALADAVLGNFRTYQEASSDPLAFYRFWQHAFYIQDSWKVTRRLSIEVGFRFEHFTPTYAQANNLSNFVPALYDPAKAVRLTTAGLIIPGSGNPLNGIVRAGDGVPQDEIGRVPGATSPATLAVPAGAPRGLYPSYNLQMPRFGFAYVPFDKRTVIRGGFGVYHDRVQGNLIFSQSLLPPYSGSVSYENANLTNPTSGSASAPAPFGSINAIDPNLKVPLTMKFNFGIQRELPRGMFLQVDYVGNLDRHLIRQPDINQPSFGTLTANQLGARLPTNVIRPYQGYSNIRQFISDSTANYNSMQTFLTRRKGNVVFSVSYTWSHALTDASSDTTNVTEEFTKRSYSYGPASFDRRHVFVVSYTYRLPTLKGHNAFIKQTLGSWQISGITRAQSGPYLTPTGNTSIGTRRSDYLGGVVILPTEERSVDRWFNTAAFANAPDGRLGTSGVGTIQAPGLYLWDLSIRKQFPISERIKLGFQAESFNLMNHLNPTGLNVTTSNTAIGSLSGSTPARNVQFGMRLTF